MRRTLATLVALATCCGVASATADTRPVSGADTPVGVGRPDARDAPAGARPGEGAPGATALTGARAGTRCPLFPASSHWYADVRAVPVHRRSDAFIATMGASARVHPDFGSGQWNGGPIGIPFTPVAADQPRVAVSFTYADESDPGPYPIPANPLIEGGPDADGDRHVLVLQRGTCRLYELYDAHPRPGGRWHAGSGAAYDLTSNRLRPTGWTSADAAGLPILPGLVRYREVEQGSIDHAIRMTVPVTRRAFVWPARHQAGSTDRLDAPPMGTWVRLGDHIDPADFPPQARVVVQALQTHGAIVADNGSSFYLSGVPDPRWDNDDLATLHELRGADFEVIRATVMMVHPDSGKVRRAYR